MMSDTIVRDLDERSGSVNETATKGTFSNGSTGTVNKNLQECQNKENTCLLPTPLNGNGVVKPEAEIVTIEVEYIESENLKDVEDVDTILKSLLDGLASKDWISMCEALNNARKLALYHKEAMLDMLENVISLLVKALKNPRSAVCKTAIMASADLFSAYGDQMVDSLDPLLVQLLLKASQDKRFVCEAAEKALAAMTTWLSPGLLLPKLQPHLKHRNPRIRAKASMCLSQSVPCLGIEGIQAYGIDKLIHIAALQLTDQLPESREAARNLLLELQTVYEKSRVHAPFMTSENNEDDSWEHFCQAKLSPLSAQAVLRVTNTNREVSFQLPSTQQQILHQI